jgi:hypothetical protein
VPLYDLLPFAIWAVVASLAALPLLCSKTIAALAEGRARLRFELGFFGVVLLGLLACRYPVLVYPAELNVDECQFIAQALGYHHDWMPFTQDGHTCGPLNYYILTWPAFLGRPITYFTIRLTGFVLILLTLFYARRTVALIAGNRYSYLLALPLVSFYFFAYQPGFVHFSSETFPEALLAFGLWQIAKYWRLDRANFLLLGAVLGATPFTKLQAAPMAVFLFIVAAGLLVRLGPRRTPASWKKRLLFLFIGGALVPLVLAVPLLATGMLGDAIYRYITVNAAYGAQLWIPDPHPFGYMLYEFAHNGPQFTIYFLGQLALSAVALAALASGREKKLSSSWLTGLGLILVLLALGGWAVVKPRQAYCHYLLLLPVLVALVPAWIARGWIEFCRTTWSPRLEKLMPVVFIVVSIFSLPLYVFEQHALPYLSTPAPTEFAPVSSYIRSVTQPGDTIANWGYTPEYYVETQLPPGVRDYSTLFELFADPQYDYFRNGFLDDLKRNRPKVIVDSVGEHYLPTWIHPIDKARMTAWKPLADYLAANYQAPEEITPTPGNPPVLVYVRKADR